MYNFAMTINTTVENEETLDMVAAILSNDNIKDKYEITNPITGEVSFIFENGNIQYMDGDFAKEFVRHLRKKN